MKKYFEYIVIVLILIVIVQGFFTVPSGVSEEEEIYRIKIHDLNKDKLHLKTKIDSIEKRYENYETKVTSDSTIIWNSDREYRDSIRAIYNPR